MDEIGTIPNIPAPLVGAPAANEAPLPTWGEVARVSEGGAAPPAASLPEERQGDESEVLDVLYAADPDGGLSLDTLSVELNADKARGHLPKGRIEALLGGLISRTRVERREGGTPPEAVYALRSESREEIDEPAIVHGARMAVLAVLAGDDWIENIGLTVPEIASALAQVRDLHADIPNDTERPWVSAIPEEAFRAFCHGQGPIGLGEIEARVARRLVGLVGPLVEEVRAATATAEDTGPDGEPLSPARLRERANDPMIEPFRDSGGDASAYRLTDRARCLYSEAGARALAGATFPPKPTLEEIRTGLDRVVGESVRSAAAQAEMFRRLYEKEVGAHDDTKRVVAAYETFHRETGLARPAVLALLRGGPDPAEIVTFEEERLIDEQERSRLIDERDALIVYIETQDDEWGRKKKTEIARLDGLRAQSKDLWYAIKNRGQRHIVRKQVTREARRIDGKAMLITLSADPHDRGRELMREPLNQIQTALPGGALPGQPEWKPTPEEGGASPRPSLHAEDPPSAPAPAPAAPVATPAPPGPAVDAPPTGTILRRWGQPVELSLKGLKPVIEVYLLGELEGVIEDELVAKVCAFLDVEVTSATTKLLMTLLKQGKKTNEIAEGEGGEGKPLLWWHTNPDPRSRPVAKPAARTKDKSAGKAGAGAKK